MRQIVVCVVVCALALLVLVGCGEVESGSDSRSGGRMDTDADSGSDGLCVSFVDVGKGDCILVQTGTSAALIDAGYTDTADDVVAYLEKRGVERLDYLIFTHYDKDHVGGANAIMSEFELGEVYIPGYEGADKCYKSFMKAVKKNDVATRQVTKDVTLSLGAAEIALYASDLEYIPDAKGDEGNDNDLSIVAGLRFANDSYLFAGDLEEEGIDAYLKDDLGHYDVLKMPHHGRKSSNTSDFLDAVKPRIVVVTDDDSDPIQSKVMRMLEDLNADVYCSSDSGTIVVESDGTGSYRISAE